MKGGSVYYNSAVRNGTLQFYGLPPTESFQLREFAAFRCNLIAESGVLLERFQTCDVIYCEPPFPAGLRTFDKRAKESTPKYSDFCVAFSSVLRSLNKPRYVILNKMLSGFLDTPNKVCSVMLNNASVELGIWGGDEPPVHGFRKIRTNLDLCSWLGRRYRKIGDFTCGYGSPLLAFVGARNGNSFVASDYDPHCITAIKKRTESLVAGLDP